VAGAEVDELSGRADSFGDFVPVPCEDRRFGSRQVVLGQLADGGKERRAQGIVEVLRRNAGRGREEAREEIAPRGALVGAQAVDDGVGRRRRFEAEQARDGGHVLPFRAASRPQVDNDGEKRDLTWEALKNLQTLRAGAGGPSAPALLSRRAAV